MSDTITLTLQSIDELKSTYLSFLKHGGIMLQSDTPLQMAQALSVSINFWDENKPITSEARVVWIAPETANTPIYKGYGVEFVGENSANIRKKMELHLAGNLT